MTSWNIVPPEIKEPEDSAMLRLLTFAAQSVAALALTIVTQIWWLFPVGVIGMAMGHYYAYQNRHDPKKLPRYIVLVLLHLGFCSVPVLITQGVPYPQAIFAVLVMALVSVEVFSRLNLYSALGMGMVALYAAATLSRDVTYGVFVLVFMALFLAFLWRADSEDGKKQNPVILRQPQSPANTPSGNHSGAGWWRWGLRFALAVLLIAPLVFILTPHYAGLPIVPPFSLTAPIQSSPTREVINPGLPLVRVQGAVNDDTDGYFGFSDSLDLSYRGGLSNTLMMYVSSPAWSYWRGYAYDTYDGQSWYQSRGVVRTIEREEGGFTIERNPDGELFSHTFYVAQDMPNIIWAGGNPTEVYFPADSIGVDDTGGIRVGDALDSGMIYTVISEWVDFTPQQLRSADGSIPVGIRTQYLQLPDTITQRTRDLAYDLTADQPTRYDQVIAIRDYLRETYPYDFFPPPLQPDSDAVDQFLFEDQRGYCEQYVSSMVVMLRELGIPTRFIVGYGSGDYNPVTGYYEVRANDAHAWTEVYFPEYGWVPFDPTPGWEGNPETGPVQRWVFSGALSQVDLPSLPLGEIADAGLSTLGALGAPLAVLLAGLGFAGIIAAAYYAYQWWRRRQPKRYHHDPNRKAIFAAYNKLQRKLKIKRERGQTIQEHAQRHPALQAIADMVDIAAYRPTPPDDDLVRDAQNIKSDDNDTPS